jgi:spermidine synthase
MVLVIATAGLVYELGMAAVASYVLGDSVTQFSTVIGVYLSALGLGAYLSKFITRDLARTFVDVELAAAVAGGLSAPLLFVAFAATDAFHFVLYGIVLLVGTLVGLELPLLMRILKSELAFEDLVAKALTFDYAGALLGSLGFSLVLLPKLGLSRASVVCGLLNAVVGLWSTWVLECAEPDEQRALVRSRPRAVIVVALLAASLFGAERIADLAEDRAYGGRVLHREQSPYQRIVVSQRDDAWELHLNGNLQLSSRDEHRYHEALVHPALASVPGARQVLIGGGGDGMAAREVLRWPLVERVVVVDLDEAMTSLARRDPRLRAQNRGAFDDPRVEVVNADAMVDLDRRSEQFDVILLDFPDPTQLSLGKLYTKRFFGSVRRRLRPDGAIAIQATSAFFTRRSYWCIVQTLEEAGFFVAPYHVFVPSFGDWGFALARLNPFTPPTRVALPGLRFLDETELDRAFRFGPELARLPVETNHLSNQALVAYYVAEQGRLE